MATMNKRRDYERPAMTIYQLRQPERLLAGSPAGASGTLGQYEMQEPQTWH